MNLAKINEVIKASPAIQVQSKMTLLQRRAWNVLLANAYNELPTEDIHRVSLAELAAKLGFNSGNREYLKEMLKSLVDCTVEWNVLGKDKKEEWGVASLLASARIKDGICTYEFAQPLRVKLHNPRIYAKLNLRLQNQFTSQYALVLWEVCFDYFDTDRAQGETPFIPLETFRELIGIGSDEYPVFGVLNRAVIKPAIKEINDLTNYHVEVEQKREHRSVSALKFCITRVKDIPIQESVFPDITNLPPVALALVQAGVDRKIALKIAGAEWGFVSPVKLPPPGSYPDFDAYVSEKIGVSLEAAGVKNRGGFIVEAIRENYEDPEFQKQRAAEMEREKQALLETLKAERLEKETILLQQAVRLNPDLLEKAAAKLAPFPRRRLEDFDTVQAAYNQGGMVTWALNGILAEEFCQDLLTPVYQAYEDEKAKILGTTAVKSPVQ